MKKQRRLTPADYGEMAARHELGDDENPKFLFSLTDTKLLLAIAKDKLDAVDLARQELANRGLGSHGQWIGFKQAKNFWNHIVYRNGKGVTIPDSYREENE